MSLGHASGYGDLGGYGRRRSGVQLAMGVEDRGEGDGWTCWKIRGKEEDENKERSRSWV